MRDLLVQRRSVLRGLLQERLEAIAEPEDLPGKMTPADLAALVATLAHGLAVQAADGMDRAGLQRITADFVAALEWPDSAG
ncbi:hypothetical protein [Acidisoma sp. 7E03]